MRKILFFLLMTASFSAFASKNPVIYCKGSTLANKFIISINLFNNTISFDSDVHKIENYSSKHTFTTDTYINESGEYIYHLIAFQRDYNLITIYTFNAAKNAIVRGHAFNCEVKK